MRRPWSKGSTPQHACVSIQGAPGSGAIDTRAHITIIGGELFAWVAAAAACLCKKDFCKPEKMPCIYTWEPFHLDGCINLDISFDGETRWRPQYTLRWMPRISSCWPKVCVDSLASSIPSFCWASYNARQEHEYCGLGPHCRGTVSSVARSTLSYNSQKKYLPRKGVKEHNHEDTCQ